ncbi:MAG: hypothetical protein KDD01_11495 [Phaeodactylibacter sp.]|nr:hypothetical protein [Phaeodactylibacter sp.]
MKNTTITFVPLPNSIRFLLVILFLGIARVFYSQELRLNLAGNEQDGYYVEVYNGPELLFTDHGAFNLKMANLDLSATTQLSSWKGMKYTKEPGKIILERDSYLAGLDANLSITVIYEQVNEQLIRKRVRMTQYSMPSMYYTLEEVATPAGAPANYLTFEYEDFPGGFVHELFPAAGFLTSDSLVVGFLTDAGYRNHFTRTTRRRFSGRGGGFVGMRKLPDPALIVLPTAAERERQAHYVKYTFGELYDLDAGAKQWFEPFSDSRAIGKAKMTEKGSYMQLACDNSERTGFELLTNMKGQKIYTISFDCRGNVPLALKLHRIKDGKKGAELEHGIKYIDRFPVLQEEWSRFEGSILIPYIENDRVSMFIGSTSGETGGLEIKGLQVVEHDPLKAPYNILPLGQTVDKTTYVFAEPWRSHQQFMISAQTRLAEGMGFHGTQLEKMLYANLHMLTWITSIHDFTPFVVPNMNYAPDMYNRDSFWSIIATYNKSLNLKIWEQWGKTQNKEGAIGTIITPYMGSVEVKDNEATIEWLIWALLNKRRFGVELPADKLDKAVAYVLNEFDADRDGRCASHFSLSQIDIRDYEPKTEGLAGNQGLFVVALQTIEALGYPIEPAYLSKAEEIYRGFYDEKRKHLLFDREYPDIISLTSLVPEFLSLWLFDKPLLTDEMVANHLEQTPILNKVPNAPHPELGTTAPICVRLTKDKKGYAYLSSDYQPFGEFGKANYKNGARDGYYYNGGSWMRAEYCAYAAGLKHGWDKASRLMENRAWAEIYLNPRWPFSKEFIPTQWQSVDSWWDSTRGLSWNVFILMADELAGLRTPEMDPDFRENHAGH